MRKEDFYENEEDDNEDENDETNRNHYKENAMIVAVTSKHKAKDLLKYLIENNVEIDFRGLVSWIWWLIL